MKRPVVAITPWLRALSTALGERTVLYTLDPGYADRVAMAGGLPIVVPIGDDPAAALAPADALVLSGGSDVHPGSYGSSPERSEEDADLEIDAWELSLVAEARRRGLPTLGICRGMQLLAVAHGGTLLQHIENASHPGMGSLRAEETLARRHTIELRTGSQLAAIVAAERIQVNTIHHQAIDDPGSLRVNATGPAGVIEGVEAEDWSALGVQWHPEKMHEPEQRRLFEHLVNQARLAKLAAAR